MTPRRGHIRRRPKLARPLARLLDRLGRGEEGFTMIVALGVLLVTSLLCAAIFLTVQGDASTTRADLDGKRAYAAAQAGVQAYLYQLNANSTIDWWETCTNDSTSAAVQVPGAATGVTYSYAPVITCNQASPDQMIDSAGNLRLEFTGVSGSATRIIVASFRTNTPLNYLWYSVHETLDPAANSACTGDPFYYGSGGGNIPASCQLNWTTGDVVNGPLYTQDQLLIGAGASPSFKSVVSADPSTDPNQVCVGGCSSTSATFTSKQTVAGGAPAVQFPSSNSSLLNDANAHGLVLSGAVTLYLSSSNPANTTVYNCPTSSTCSSQTVNLNTTQILYATNGSSCNTAYAPNDVTYSLTSVGGKSVAYGPCGDIYVSGTYSVPLTLASANDIVITGNLENATDTNGTTTPTGIATLGLIANQYVRVAHPASGFTTSAGTTTCNNYSAPNPNVTIDAAILTLQHSFFVDNYACGSSTTGTLTVHGVLAQYYRGAVGVSYGNTPTGYLKNYNYDARLADILPPYMFDLQNTNWSVTRETLCSTVTGTCTGS